MLICGMDLKDTRAIQQHRKQTQQAVLESNSSERPSGGTSLISKSSTLHSRAIPLSAILLIALAVHGPLLLMQLPAGSYDANTHMFFAATTRSTGSIPGT